MIKIFLENSYYTFGNRSYKQNDGMYMGECEEMLLSKRDKKPLEYIRYVDDIFGIWTHGEESLVQFHKLANYI
ncbi:UNVERIFIED_CONTAM: hypothetical protein FKN15_039562 [Acipenser sinensis]